MTPNLSVQPGRRIATRRRRLPPSQWQADLPKEWQRQVVAPLSIEKYRDYEVAAERVIGRDEDDHPCYCRSRFVVTDIRSDDDEEFYAVIAYVETLAAWRLRDGRWLIYRELKRDNERGRAFYSFGETMPR